MITEVPKKVDHEQRRRQITDAVCQITLRDGLSAATFRAVAAEAGVSAPLVQHYFATKAELLETTQRHVGERSTARLLDWIDRTDGSPRQVLGAFMKSFIPADDYSRTAAMMYLALATEAVIPTHQNHARGGPRQVEAELMLTTIVGQLERGPLRYGVTPDIEARLLTALTTGLGQYVMLETMSPTQAYAAIDYHLDRTFLPANDRDAGDT
jgi:AcrR family transcriptional regulator